jgi:hypothetical protein
MKTHPRSFLVALALSLTVAAAAARADYMPADRQLEKLENIVTLTSAQEKQALQIFQNLKDIIDSLSQEDRANGKGVQSHQDAVAAIRSLLTPAQQAVYDRTPQRLGGSGKEGGDPAMSALRLKLSTFVRTTARTSPEIAAQVGTVQKISLLNAGNSMTSGPAVANTEDPQTHPDAGTNLVRVTGTAATKVFTISWRMSPAGELALAKITPQAD